MKIIILILIIFLSGCSNESIISCKINIDNKKEEYASNFTYEIYYKDKYVKKIKINETYNSNVSSKINYFEELRKSENEYLNLIYGGFAYDINRVSPSELLVNINIDCDSTDIKQMVKDGYLSKNYVSGNRLTLIGAKSMFESIGATCK